MRKFTWEGSLENFENGAGQTETRIWLGRFNTELQNSDQFTFEVAKNYELLVDPFAISPGVIIPAGGYRFHRCARRPTCSASSVRRRAACRFRHGQFYDGTITRRRRVGRARRRDRSNCRSSPVCRSIACRCRHGDSRRNLLRARTDYGFSPRMFASALMQYNSADDTFSSNLRFRWEYQPGSELFVVYTDERDTEDWPAFSGSQEPRVRREDQPAVAVLESEQDWPEDLASRERMSRLQYYSSSEDERSR